MTTVYLSPIGNGYNFATSGWLPLASGKLYTFLAGTDTPQATWTTAAGDVENANPIILGVDGRPPFEIWLEAGVAYLFSLADSDDNPIQDYDNITGVNDITVSTPQVTIKDEGVTQGQASVLDFTGSGITASASGGVATINVPGIVTVSIKDEGTPQGSVSILNFVGPGITASAAAGTATITVPGAGSDSGLVVQLVRTDTGSAATGSTAIPWDDTPPLNTEGDEYMSVSITPTDAANNLRVTVSALFAAPTNFYFIGAIFRDATAQALTAGVALTDTVNGMIHLQVVVPAGSTSETTFKFRAGGSTAITLTFNGHGGTRKLGGVANSFIQVEEVTA